MRAAALSGLPNRVFRKMSPDEAGDSPGAFDPSGDSLVGSIRESKNSSGEISAADPLAASLAAAVGFALGLATTSGGAGGELLELQPTDAATEKIMAARQRQVLDIISASFRPCGVCNLCGSSGRGRMLGPRSKVS
jgi:hypothetical protein